MSGKYEIHVKDYFTGTHALRGYDGKSAEKHRHKWTVEARVQLTTLNKRGIGMDFKDLKNVIRDILGKLDHTHLNEVVEFGSINPTAENLAKFIYTEMSRRLNTDRIKVNKVKVFETPDCGSSYCEI